MLIPASIDYYSLMQCRHQFLAITALFCSCVYAAETDPDSAVRRLGDPDPAIRKRAFDALLGMHEKARDALRAGTLSQQPAIADASRQLLMRLPWSEPGDPEAAVEILEGYGSSDDQARATKLLMLIQGNDPKMLAVARRVADNEPSDDVLWRSVGLVRGKTAWSSILNDIDPKQARPALLHLAAWSCMGTDEDRGAALLKVLIDREIASPTAKAENLQRAIELLASRAKTFESRAAILLYLRHLVDLSSYSENGAQNAAADLLLFQSRWGPFPGAAQDFAQAAEVSDRRALLAGAYLAKRLGADIPGRLLFSCGLEPTDELPEDKRLSEQLANGNYLIRLGEVELAESVLTKIAVVNANEETTSTISSANLRLYDIYSAKGDHLRAAQRLETVAGVVSNRTQRLLTRRHGDAEVWDIDEIRATITWQYFKHAMKQKNEPEVKRLATELAQGKSTDERIFLDTLDEIQPRVSAADFIKYFERVYAVARNRVKNRPDEAVMHNDFAWLCARAGQRLDEVLTHAQEAVKRAPQSAAYLDTLAEVYFRLGRVDEAVATEQRAIALMPDDEFMHTQLARFKKLADEQKGQK